MTRTNSSTRRLCSCVLTLVAITALAAGWRQSAAAELPNAPAAQIAAAQVAAQSPSVSASPGTLAGFITDANGASIAGAHVTLAGSPPRVAVTDNNGRFALPDVPPGAFQLSVTADGFAPQQTSGQLQPGEARELPFIALDAASTTNIEVTASQVEIAQAQVNQEEKQRVFGVLPNFYVSYVSDPVPLSGGQKFDLAVKTLIDPVNFVLNGVTAGIQQADNTYNWGQGAAAFGKRYAAAYGTFMNSTLIGSAALPVLLKQDPRYFYKGTGSNWSRAGYAIANAIICKGDNHHWQVNYSAIIGGLAAGAISNLYYPAPNRAGVGLMFEGAAIGTGMAAAANLLQEFVVHKLTPHAATVGPANPAPAAKPATH